MGKASSIWTIGYYYGGTQEPNHYWRVDKIEDDRMYYTYWYEDGTFATGNVLNSSSKETVKGLQILWEKIDRDTVEREVKEAFNGET